MSKKLVIVESPARRPKPSEKYLPEGCDVIATTGHVTDFCRPQNWQ